MCFEACCLEWVGCYCWGHTDRVNTQSRGEVDLQLEAKCNFSSPVLLLLLLQLIILQFALSQAVLFDLRQLAKEGCLEVVKVSLQR